MVGFSRADGRGSDGFEGEGVLCFYFIFLLLEKGAAEYGAD